VDFEIRTAESIFTRYDIPCISTTECSIEEIASRILDKTGLERRLRP
jgi:regulator of PEP synthase PpsR (kinase-PPPase family)